MNYAATWNLYAYVVYPEGPGNHNEIRSASEMWWFSEGGIQPGSNTQDKGYQFNSVLRDPISNASEVSRFVYPHSGVNNTVFMDGHVETVTQEFLLDSRPTDAFWIGQ